MNPNNSSELVFVEGVYPHSKVVFFNMETKEKRILFHENVSGNISWSKKDWVLFQRTSDSNLYKIKSNGDSLTQVTHGGNWFHGQWNHQGNKFITYSKSNSINRSFIMDESGTVIDSLTNWQHQAGNWSHPLYYLGRSAFQIIVMDIENKSVVKKIDFDKEIGFASWVSATEIIYRQGTRNYVYNILTDANKMIGCECHKNLSRGTYSSDFSKLIFAKIENSLQSNNRIFSDSKLIIMDKNGLNQQEILP